MTAPDSSPPPAGDGGSGFDRDKLKEQLNEAGQKAKTAATLLSRIVKPMLPKKWSFKHIAIVAGVVIVLLIVLNVIIQTLWSIFMIAIPAVLILAGLYFIFFAKR